MLIGYFKKVFRKPAPVAENYPDNEPRIIADVQDMIIENAIAASMCHEFEEDLVLETISDRTGVSRSRVFRSINKINDILPHELIGQYNLKSRLIRAATAAASFLLEGISEEEAVSRLISQKTMSDKTPKLAASTVRRVGELAPEDMKKLAGLAACGVDYLLLEIIKAEKQEGYT